ncbi:Uncharacterised protein [Vibrio cholerae]|nr:Uncharacterised protein [Vibrio cholerae]
MKESITSLALKSPLLAGVLRIISSVKIGLSSRRKVLPIKALHCN